MNAIKFIQQHGVDKAREVVEGAPARSTHLSGFTGQIYKDSGDAVYVWDGMKYHKSIYEHTQGMLSLSELKRLVESVEIIKEVGIIPAKKITKEMMPWYFPVLVNFERLKQAIAHYESIYGGEHV